MDCPHCGTHNVDTRLSCSVCDADLRPSSSPVPTMIPCYQHPGQAAVRTCAGCGVGLCDACYTERDQQPYCQRCLAEQVDPAPLSSELAEGEGYAGFAVRCAASIGDLLIMLVMFAALFFLFAYSILFAYRLKMVFPAERSDAIPLLLTELFGSACLIWYLIAPLARYGRTLGQKLWGLRVVDRQGNTPALVAALIRFAYLLVSCLFLFPLFGYLFVLFSPKKQGWHDRLAGTYVVTKRPRLKAVLAWTLIGTLIGFGIWGINFSIRLHSLSVVTLTVTKTGSGTGTVWVGAQSWWIGAQSCDAACAELTVPAAKNSALTLKAQAAAGSRFVRWETATGNVLTGTLPPLTANSTVIAVFEKN